MLSALPNLLRRQRVNAITIRSNKQFSRYPTADASTFRNLRLLELNSVDRRKHHV